MTVPASPVASARVRHICAAKPEPASSAIQGSASSAGVTHMSAVGTAEKASSSAFTVNTMRVGDSVSAIVFTQTLLTA